MQRVSRALIDAIATYGVQAEKGRESNEVKIHGLRIRTEHQESSLTAIESEGLVKNGVNDNHLNMFNMKDVKTCLTYPYMEKGVYSLLKMPRSIRHCMES